MASIVPENPLTKAIFQLICLAPNDEIPIVEMNDQTARDMDIIWASIDDAAKRWRGEQNARIPLRSMDRKEFWGEVALKQIPYDTPPILPVLQKFITETSGEGKLAIDLGCGSGSAIKPLLQKGWRIIAVDNSRPALNLLAQKYRAAVESGQLQIVEADMTEFAPSEPADLVIAADSLPYINPSKFRATWTKIHDTFVKEEGFLIGNLFRFTPQNMPLMNVTKEYGAWLLPDRRMVRPLLTQTGYDIKTCAFLKDPVYAESMYIQFIAQKLTSGKNLHD